MGRLAVGCGITAVGLLGLRRFSPSVIFLGSYPRADRVPVSFDQRYRDEVFTEAREWLASLTEGEGGGVEGGTVEGGTADTPRG